MLLMRQASITRGGGWALEIESFLGPVELHRADRRVPFGAHEGGFRAHSVGVGEEVHKGT
jgi:hypothetical protein